MSKVLFITEKQSFMSKAFISHLEGERFEVMNVKPDVTAISRIEEPPLIFILFLQNEENLMTDVLGYLRDLVEDKEIRLFVIGTQDELEAVMAGFPPQNITKTYIRPVDMDEFTKDLKKEGEAIDRAEEFKTILIVDDDPTALRQMKNLLSSRYKIFVANSGMNAITILAKNQIDLILLDYEMPVVDGPKVLEMLRNDPGANSIPVMFLTAKGDKESIMNVVNLKPEKYLLKTMAPREIMDAIDEFFATHR